MSKSVKLTANAATTGRKKNTPMTSRAGATKIRPAAAALTRRTDARGAPPLLENPPRACVEHSGRFVHRDLSVRRTLGHEADFGGDTLPLRHLGRRLHALELLAERPRVDVVRQRRIVPRAAPRRQ